MIKFKTAVIEGQFKWRVIKPRLKKLIDLISLYVELKYKKNIMITGLIRTQAGQDSIYKDNPRYKKKPWKSVHQFGRGCDLRSWTFTMNQINDIKKFANMVPYREGKKTCVVHNVGRGLHFHFQVL